MKKILSISVYALLLTAFLSTTSCKKEDETQTVSYNLDTYDLTVCAGCGAGEFDIENSDVQAAFASVGITYDLTKVVTAKLTGLSVKAFNGTTLSDVSEIEVFIDGVRIAHSSNLSGTSTNALVIDDVELKSYLGTTPTITVEATPETASDFAFIRLSGGVIQAEVQK